MKETNEPRFIKKIKSKLFIKDEFQKLSFLSNELKRGKASEADKAYWDEALRQIEEYLPYVPEQQELYEMYKKRRMIVDHQARVRKLKHYEGGVLVASSLRGLFDTLRIQREKHEKKNDVVVVMGDWMAFEGDMSSIHKAMDLAEEGVVFLRGRKEELFLQLAEEETPEVFFVSCLPMDVQTPNFIVSTGTSMEETLSVFRVPETDKPNLTGKTIVSVQPEVDKPTMHLNDKQMVLLAPGDALRLEMKDKSQTHNNNNNIYNNLEF